MGDLFDEVVNPAEVMAELGATSGEIADLADRGVLRSADSRVR
ncbi:hypothetical protein [Candidatus Poriferisodalis sp.]